MRALRAAEGLEIYPLRIIAVNIVGILGVVQAPDLAANIAVSFFVGNAGCRKGLGQIGVIVGRTGVVCLEKAGNALAGRAAEAENMVDTCGKADIQAPDAIAVGRFAVHCRGFAGVQRQHDRDVVHFTVVAQRSVSGALPGVGRVDELHTDIKVAVVPCTEQRIAVCQIVFVCTLPVVGAIPCRTAGDQHVLGPIAEAAVNGNGALLAKSGRIGSVVARQCSGSAHR